MEPKKTEKADLTKKTGLFFSIGLCATMLITVAAFEYKKHDDKDVRDMAKNQNVFEEIMEVPPTEQPPPPPPKIQQPQIVEVPDEEEVEQELEFTMDNEITQDSKVETIINPIVEDAPKEDPNEIFMVVEESAAPKGGMAAFYEYVGKKMAGKYPAQARRMGIEGKVFVEFIIEKNGTLTDVKVVKGIGGGCDELAKKVVAEAPPWNPGKQRGKPVRQKMVLPIVFKLN